MTSAATDGPLLRLAAIRKAFGPVEVLKGVSLDIRRGEAVALMGANGAGKSTLLNILCGALSPDAGGIWLEGREIRFSGPAEAHRAGIAMVHQELHLAPELDIADNIFLGVAGPAAPRNRRSRVSAAEAMLRQLGCARAATTKVRALGLAERQMVEIAKGLTRDARLLILDEPTAALSDGETEVLFRVLRHLLSQGVALVYVSHRMEEIEALTDRVVVMRDGAIVSDRSTSETTRAQLICDMVGRELGSSAGSARPPPGAPVLEAVDVNRWTADGRRRLEGVEFTLHRGEILGVAGLMGAGRTELMEVLCGACDERWTGSLRLEERPFRPRSPAEAVAAGVAYVTEDRKGSGLVLDQTIADNIALASLPALSRAGFISPRRTAEMSRRWIADLGVRATGPHQEAGLLSGGNQQKVVLAKWLETGPRVLLLDEPTRGVDVVAKRAIHELLERLAAQGMAILLISSEWIELMSLSDRILVLQAGRPSAIFAAGDADQATLLDHAAPGGAVQPRFSRNREAA